MSAMKAIEDCYLYGIVDLGYASPENLRSVTERMIEGGVDILQLRAKGFAVDAVAEFAKDLAPLACEAKVPFIINDHPTIVQASGATGVHVGQDDLAVSIARNQAGGGDLLVGKSTHSVTQATAALVEKPDYIGFGPLFATPTKPDYVPIGVDDIRQVHELVDIPIFCIGGVKLENMQQILAAGARRVVIVSGILQADDIVGYCRDVKALVEAANDGCVSLEDREARYKADGKLTDQEHEKLHEETRELGRDIIEDIREV